MDNQEAPPPPADRIQPSDNSDSEQDISFDQDEFNKIYTNELKKQQAKLGIRRPEQNEIIHISEQMPKEEIVDQNKMVQEVVMNQAKERAPSWHIYDQCDNLVLDSKRFSSYVLNLPIYKKKQDILNYIINNQVVLITGETGCGKSTQVPRLIYQYILATQLKAKIICVQPRRLAVKNLHKLLTDQIPEKGAVGYHIAMQTFIRENTKILFMTNGIFLQRLVHGTQFFEEFPFIILDQVHQRDIDTDFILLSIKRILRNHPKLRVILMSATIDNKIFQYYFAQDQIDTFMTRENFYKKFIRMQEQTHNHKQEQDEQNGYNIQRIGEEDDLYKKIQMQYLKSELPCPTVNVTEKGKHKKQYYYLDTLNQFFQRAHSTRWGSISFLQKAPTTNKQIYSTVCQLLNEIMLNSPKDRSNQSVLIFLPGMGEIEYMASSMIEHFKQKLSNFEIIKCHSTILNDDVTKKLHMMYQTKFKVIIATNIAESSITVFGIKYVIDFCLSKQINFNQKSRMQNLQLVWASKASCEQRAGRTGRVCDGLVFRMVQRDFYRKLNDYSTPQIQRSSLDKLILRIKLIHQNQNGSIFEDPGEVLGTSIQPPNLKNIDQSIKALILCGGLNVKGESLNLTKLGRIYVDIPLDIIYCKMLIFSMLMGTFDDILILVCILSQNKNVFKKYQIERFPLQFFEIMTNPQRCDFVALVSAYRKREQSNKNYKNNKERSLVEFDIYYEVKLLIQDVSRRIKQKKLHNKIYPSQKDEDYDERFKMTIAFGFMSNLIKVGAMIYDDRQEKRYKLMKRQGIPVKNTIVFLNSDVIRKSADQNQQADIRLKKTWIQNISNAFRIKPQNFAITLGQGISFIHFSEELDLNKFLFIKHMQRKGRMGQDKSSKSFGLNQILPHLGDIDYMQQGNPTQYFKDHKVNIDNFSGNRIVAVNKQNQSFQFPTRRFLVTNSITQQSSRLSVRFASLLPDINSIQAILHLAFHPFVSLLADKKYTKYDKIHLRKRAKIHINYELTDQQIEMANEIRDTIKDLMDLSLFSEQQVNYDNLQPTFINQDGAEQQVNNNDPLNFQSEQIMESLQTNKQNKQKLIQAKIQNNQAAERQELRKLKIIRFWPLLKNFILKQRKTVLQQQKWQQLYYKQMKIDQIQKGSSVKQQKEQKEYMNQIRILPNLRNSYFSSNNSDGKDEKLQNYQNWKIKKYNQVKELESIALDHDPYIICQTCKIKIARLNKLGPISNNYFRQLFEHLTENVQQLPYNELGDYFCSMLMTIHIDRDYDVYGCANGHYLALKFRDERRMKILTFSPISVLYTDGTEQTEPEFDTLQFRYWKKKFDESRVSKLKKPRETYCFVCGQKFKNVKELEEHVKNQYHEANMRDFKSTIPESKRGDKKDNVLSSATGGY